MSVSPSGATDPAASGERAPAASRGLCASSARHLLGGVHPRTFEKFARAGVFRRIGVTFDEATLHRNYALALEAERDAQSRIATIEAELRARLAAIGTMEGPAR